MRHVIYRRALCIPMKNFAFFKLLYADYKDELLRFALRKLGGEDDAEDIVQDTFQNIMGIENPEDIENPRAYLYRTAQNIALNRQRQSGRHRDYVASCDENAVSISLERKVIAQKDLDKIELGLKSLPEVTRQVFFMNRIEGKKYHQIADELGVSVSSVEKHIMKVLKKLRNDVEE